MIPLEAYRKLPVNRDARRAVDRAVYWVVNGAVSDPVFRDVNGAVRRAVNEAVYWTVYWDFYRGFRND